MGTPQIVIVGVIRYRLAVAHSGRRHYVADHNGVDWRVGKALCGAPAPAEHWKQNTRDSSRVCRRCLGIVLRRVGHGGSNG